jgi:hypothetical protein
VQIDDTLFRLGDFCMKNLLSSTLVASMCALAGVSVAQTSTTPAATGTQTREQADRKGAPPPATSGTTTTTTTGGSSMGATSSGQPKANTATRTEEQAARNDGDPTSIYDRKGMGAMLKRMDANSDGMVSRDEYMQFHEGVYQRMPKDGNGMVSVGTGTRRP